MNKHTYRSKKVNAINWEQLRERWSGQALLFAVDVAKDGQYAELSWMTYTFGSFGVLWIAILYVTIHLVPL